VLIATFEVWAFDIPPPALPLKNSALVSSAKFTLPDKSSECKYNLKP